MGARRLEKRKSNHFKIYVTASPYHEVLSGLWALSMKDTPFASFLDGKRFREACIEGKLQRNRRIT